MGEGEKVGMGEEEKVGMGEEEKVGMGEGGEGRDGGGRREMWGREGW